MATRYTIPLLLWLLCLVPAGISHAAGNVLPELPDWQVLEFEEKAFWATARSRLEIVPVPDDPALWELDVLSSVVANSEQIKVRFDPATGRAVTRSRLSRGKEQRVKSYEYQATFILRKRRNPAADPALPPDQWPVASSRKVRYPPLEGDAVVTSPYMLVLLAQRLQAQGEDHTLNVVVHTDLNFYQVRLTSGNGIPIDVNYQVSGGETVRGRHETLAVALQVTPVAPAPEEDDFSLLGLQGDIILFFDRDSGLPVQVRGVAPRIGNTEINLKSVTMREAGQ
ncbi:MAG: hypothetical protein R3E50_13070 [Halioglobus sp.]